MRIELIFYMVKDKSVETMSSFMIPWFPVPLENKRPLLDQAQNLNKNL